MKRVATLAALFWVGAFLTGLLIDLLDVYWIGHPSPHSQTALFQIQVFAALIAATAGAVLYWTCLVVQRLKFVSSAGNTFLLAMASGVGYSVTLALSGQGVLLTGGGGTTVVGWMLLLLLPIGLALLMRLSTFQNQTF